MSAQPLRPLFQQLQYQFAAHIRDPLQAAPSQIEDRRMKIYRELFFNNIESFLANGFPVLRSLMSDESWQALARDFFSRHQCHTPYFLEISQEFLTYLQSERCEQAGDFPFMLELAHYEWLELAMDVDPDCIPATGFNPEGDLLQGQPVLSPLVNVACYEYPVHHISRDFIPQAPSEQPHYLIIYRNSADQVRFMEINAVTARMLVLLQEVPGLTGRDVIQRLQQELQHPQPEVVVEGGRQALQHLRRAGIVLGTALQAR